jgi:hypothetical protein
MALHFANSIRVAIIRGIVFIPAIRISGHNVRAGRRA